MKNNLKLAIMVIALITAFCFIGCDTEKENEDDNIIVDFSSFTSPLVVNNMTGERFVVFVGTPNKNTLIGGVPAYALEHGLEKKETLFNATGYYILNFITEAEYNKNKNNLSNAPIFTSILAIYNHETNIKYIYEISYLLGGDGQITIKNPTSWNIIIRKDSPNGVALACVPPNTSNIILRLNPDIYDLYPVFSKYNSFTKEITNIIPKFTTGALEGKPYVKTFDLLATNPQSWDFADVSSSLDLTMTSGGIFIKVKNEADISISLKYGSNILSTPSGFTSINSGSEYLFYIPTLRNPDGTFPSRWILSNLFIGQSETMYNLPEFECEIDYIYSVRVTGENISSLEIDDIEDLGVTVLEL